MVPHMSGTSLDAQKRYADGTKAILESYLTGKLDYRPQDLIVHQGDYATKAYGDRAKNSGSSGANKKQMWTDMIVFSWYLGYVASVELPNVCNVKEMDKRVAYDYLYQQ